MPFRTVAAFLLLIGCSPRSFLETPVSHQHRALATSAANELRVAFNQGGCQSIYKHLATHHTLQREQAWLDDCDRVLTILGPWHSFRVERVQQCGGNPPVICIAGASTFARGTRRLELAWLIDGGRPYLCWVSVAEGERWETIPPLPGLRDYDPPARPVGVEPG